MVLTSLDPSPHCAPQKKPRRLTCTRGSRPARAFYLQYPLPVTVSTSQRRVACTPDYRHHTPTAATSIAAALPRRAGRCSGQAQCVMLHLMEWAGCTSNMFVISDFQSPSSSVSWNWKLKCPTTEPTELLWLHKMQRKRTNTKSKRRGFARKPVYWCWKPRDSNLLLCWEIVTSQKEDQIVKVPFKISHWLH